MNTQLNTLDFYNKHTHAFIEQTIHIDMDALYQPFINNLSQSIDTRILDVGCGAGRDAIYFANLGYQVIAIDGSQQLINWAKRHHNSDIDWQCCTFNGLTQKNWQQKFNGIWACASLLHVPFNKLPTLMNTLLAMLNADGVLYASFKYGECERIDTGRFFCDMNESRWVRIRHNLNHQILEDIWLTTDQRAGSYQRWFNVLIKKAAHFD